MTNMSTELDRLQHQIGQATAETRHKMEPQLRRLIERMRADGVVVPKRAKCLHEALLCEAIEAQFDNMPV